MKMTPKIWIQPGKWFPHKPTGISLEMHEVSQNDVAAIKYATADDNAKYVQYFAYDRSPENDALYQRISK